MLNVLACVHDAEFLPSSGRVDTAMWMHHMDAN